MKEGAKLKRKALHRGIVDILVSTDDVTATKQLFEKRRLYQKDSENDQNNQSDRLDLMSISDQLSDQDLDQKINDQSSSSQILDQNTVNSSRKIVEQIQYHDMARYHNGTVSQHGTVPSYGTVPPNSIEEPLTSGYFEMPNCVADDIAKLLDPFEWTIYFRLFRLSYGWHKNTCLVGVQALVNATNICENQVRIILKKLQQKSLIKAVETVNTKQVKGTLYRIYTVPQHGTVPSDNTVPSQITVPPSRPIKDDDDLLKNRSSSKRKLIDDDNDLKTDHFARTKSLYEELTQNQIKLADIKAYKQIKNVPLEVIKEAISIVTNRSSSRPNSLNYFVKEILQLANPKDQSRTQRKKKLEQIVKQISSAYVGASLPISELAARTKDSCARQGVAFDHDLFNEVVNSK